MRAFCGVGVGDWDSGMETPGTLLDTMAVKSFFGGVRKNTSQLLNALSPLFLVTFSGVLGKLVERYILRPTIFWPKTGEKGH